MNSNDLVKENRKLQNSNKHLIDKNKKYVDCIKAARSYILNHSTYELPNEWIFHGDISFVFDLLDISSDYYKVSQKGKLE